MNEKSMAPRTTVLSFNSLIDGVSIECWRRHSCKCHPLQRFNGLIDGVSIEWSKAKKKVSKKYCFNRLME